MHILDVQDPAKQYVAPGVPQGKMKASLFLLLQMVTRTFSDKRFKNVS